MWEVLALALMVVAFVGVVTGSSDFFFYPVMAAMVATIVGWLEK
jgi:hypothetical protein